MGYLDFHGIGGDWHVTDLVYFEHLLKKLDSSGERTVQAVGGRLLVTMKPGDAIIGP